MSLGPPLDASGERSQLVAGAITVVVLLAAVAIALLASDRSLGESITVRVQVRAAGALRTGAHVRAAGQQVGEVVAIRGVGWSSQAGATAGDRPAVELEVRLLRAWRHLVPRNATFFAHSDNVLTEPTLEIGPPPAGAAPERPIEDGETVRGADPPDMDRFLEKVHGSVTAILRVARELDPDWSTFRGAFSQLLRTLDEVIEPGVIARVAVQGQRALTAAEHLLEALQASRAPARVQRLGAELASALDAMGPDLRLIGRRLGALDDQLRGLTSTFGPEQRRQLDLAVTRFRRAIEAAERLSGDARWLLRYVEAGGGTVGGFRQDIQIFDELKEIHRILKRETPRVLIKRPDAGQRHLR